MLTSKKVLIVDSSATAREVLERTLKTIICYPVIVAAETAEEGMAAFEKALSTEPFHLVITAFNFQRFDGSLLASLLKNKSKECRIILHSGISREILAVEGDFDKHVLKGDPTYTIGDALHELYDDAAQVAVV